MSKTNVFFPCSIHIIHKVNTMNYNLSQSIVNIPFGFYIKTFKPDYNLTRTLIASIEHFCPNVPIVIIPGDDFKEDSLFGYPTMRSDNPTLTKLIGYFKKLWCFFGPIERFIYIDSDSLVVRNMNDIFELVRETTMPFTFVCSESKLASPDQPYEPSQKAFYQSLTGDLELQQELDPEYDYRGNFPFNTSFIGSHRGAISLDLLDLTFFKTQALHKALGLPPLNNSREGVFMTDQGLINYLIYKEGIQPVFLQDVFLYGKKENDALLKGQMKNHKPYAHAVVTWPGYPRPSVLRKDLAGADLWNQFFHQSFSDDTALNHLRETIRNGSEDIRKRVARRVSKVKRRIMNPNAR